MVLRNMSFFIGLIVDVYVLGRGRRGHDCMVVGFTTLTYHH